MLSITTLVGWKAARLGYFSTEVVSQSTRDSSIFVNEVRPVA